MSFAPDSDMHKRRKGRNMGVALCLVAFIGLLFALTTVKIRQSGPVEAYDHVPRATALPQTETQSGTGE